MNCKQNRRKKIFTFEMKYYGKTLRIPWIEKVTYKDVMTITGINSVTLLKNVRRFKIKCFGHIKRHVTLECKI